MCCFRFKNLEKLKEYLQSCNIHDGFFRYATYDKTTDSFFVHIENSVWNDFLDIEFAEICKFISISENKWGEDETVNCLIVINEMEDVPVDIKPHDYKEKLCFAWEMFSGNQIYIVCSEVKFSDTGDGSVCFEDNP